MNTLEQIDKRALKEMLIKNWMTHDAMWLYHCMEECGIDAMNRVNQAAVRSMAAVEIMRIRKLLGIPREKKVESFDELMKIMETAFDIVKGDFMDFTYQSSPDGIISWRWNRCFAHEGISGLGLLDSYKCGILTRINSWLDTLGVSYSQSPVVDKCIKPINGKCEGEYRIML